MASRECTALFMFESESFAGTYLVALDSNCRDTDASGDADHGPWIRRAFASRRHGAV